MKKLIILMGLALAMMLGCTRDKVKEFIPGVYVNSAGGEFSVASDTLVIEMVEGNNYVIHRRTGFNLVSDGKIGRREYETEQWKAIYSAENQSLTEVRKGKLISFFPDKNYLSVGARVYQKLN
ncbi:hypothetical protein ACHMWN_08650 [Pedobacter sp. UC225_61]|uniref:hypothetical protein n=1 Tax=Pedobacter sp. UC225_61 TaxID=3374623 RepID=UPI0037A9B8B4